MLGLFGVQRNTDEDDFPQYDLICKILKNRKGPKNNMWKLDLNPRNFQLDPNATPWKPAKKKNKGNDL
jgi:hypothetical protein